LQRLREEPDSKYGDWMFDRSCIFVLQRANTNKVRIQCLRMTQMINKKLEASQKPPERLLKRPRSQPANEPTRPATDAATEKND
jgi:hypothetical protein